MLKFLNMEDYRKFKDDFIRLGDIVHERLQKIANDAGILVMGKAKEALRESCIKTASGIRNSTK